MKRNCFMVPLLFLSLVFMFGACASTPKGPPPTYQIMTKPVAAGYLQGKKAVIFDIVTAERGKASAQVQQSRGGAISGLFAAIGTGVAAGRVIAYNSRARKFDEANEAVIKNFLTELYSLVATAWQKAYNAETVQAAYDFGKTKPTQYFFNRPNAATKKQIADICAQNNAEFAVSITQQIMHGAIDQQGTSV